MHISSVIEYNYKFKLRKGQEQCSLAKWLGCIKAAMIREGAEIGH